MIARFWPVDAVVGENGAFWFRYDRNERRMHRRLFVAGDTKPRLDALAREILAAVPGAAVAADQRYRLADLAIDFAEDVGPLASGDIDRIVALFEAAGARAKVSSIHVNGWFGAWDKLATARRLFEEDFGMDVERHRDEFVFVGDSPNDEPMFAFFPNAVGVANLRRFAPRMASLPAWITEKEAGAGFVELADLLLEARR
jgi:hypothetical protein